MIARRCVGCNHAIDEYAPELTLCGACADETEADDAARALRAALARVGGLVACPDLARRWGISRARVHQLSTSPGFPEPVAHIGKSPVFIAAECDAWWASR